MICDYRELVRIFCYCHWPFVLSPPIHWPKTPYFQNKTIKIVRGGEPGGTGDLQARALIPYLKKHIPGDPTIIVENMPGAAGRKAANYIFRLLSRTAFRSAQSARA